MKNDTLNWKDFAPRIILPTVLAIVLFIAELFGFVIPAFKKRMLEDKRDMLRELTETAWNVVVDSARLEAQGKLTREQAQAQAISRIMAMRYGPDDKDYFWITDMQPVMLAHPYTPDLVGRDLSTYQDSHGKKLFNECVQTVRKNGGGYIDYMWQWMDDPDRIVPKLSYVKGFESWGWIVGTGIYLEDVRLEISALTRRLVIVSTIIIILIFLLLLVVTHQSLRLERMRGRAEEELRQARDKYQTLVEASSEGVIMFLAGQYCYSNKAAHDLLGYSADEFAKLDIINPPSSSENLSGAAKYFKALMAGDDVPATYTAQLQKKSGDPLDVLLEHSQINLSGQTGHIIIVRDLSDERRQQELKRAAAQEKLLGDLQGALGFLNQPLTGFMKTMVSCPLQSPVSEATRLMGRKHCDALIVTSETGEQLGIITEHDLRVRVLAGNVNLDAPVFEIMSSPIISISDRSLVFEAALLMQEKDIGHLAVKNATGKIVSIVNSRDLLQVQGVSSTSLLQEIQRAHSVDGISRSCQRLPLMVQSLIKSGANPHNTTQIITGVADMTMQRLIDMAIAKQGPPPAPFAFLTMGSQGRGEQTLVTDQDNILIFDNVPSDQIEPTRDYFLTLAKTVCEGLNEVGYAFCKGEAMAMNPKWCQPLAQWQSQFSDWINTATPQDLLEVNIFFDFRTTYGDKTLENHLREHIRQAIADRPEFLLHFSLNCLLYKPPVGLFGGIRVKADREHGRTFSIKEAMTPVVNFARIYALQNGIDETGTLARLERLLESKVITQTTYDEVIQVYNALMQMRLKHQAQAISTSTAPDNHINPKELTELERSMLKHAFAQITTLQSKISFDFKGMA